MAYSDPLTLLPVVGSAVIEGNQVKEKSFIIVGARSGGPQRESDRHEIIRYTFVDGTAKWGQDYGVPGAATSGEVKIKYGGGTASMFVPLIVDTLAESDETFFVRFDRINKPEESQTLQVVIVDRPLSEPAPLPPEIEKPAPAWWPPGFPKFDDRKVATADSGDSASSESDDSASSESGGAATSESGGSATSESGGPATSEPGVGQAGVSTERTRSKAAKEDAANAANETTDVSNISYFDIIPQVVSVDGKNVPKFFFDMSDYATTGIDKLGGSRLPDFIHLLDSDDRFTGGRGGDLIFGDAGNDWIHGNGGGDDIHAEMGNDTIKGGHGHDKIFGGQGSDWIWGGIGQNTVDAGANDGNSDQIFVPVDQVQNLEFGNPDSANADILNNLGLEDRIFMHGLGISDISLTYGATSHNGISGIGIYANGTLEALVTGNFNTAQIDSMTTGGFFA